MDLVHTMTLFKSLLIILLVVVAPSVKSDTDTSDAYVLGMMYQDFSSPSKLSSWTSNNGRDPCGDNWLGIKCSGSRVAEINLSSLGLSGKLSPSVQNLTSLTNLDLSYNNLLNDVAFYIPPYLKTLNLAGCGYVGRFPVSVLAVPSLEYLNISHNHIVGQLIDIFGHSPNLATLDMSFNLLSGILPDSIRLLTRMSYLYLENNQFSGTIDMLAGLPLVYLNVAYNRFTGRVPNQLHNTHLETDGNLWDDSPPVSPPPPPVSPPPPATPEPKTGNQMCPPTAHSTLSSIKSTLSSISMYIDIVLIIISCCWFVVRVWVHLRRRRHEGIEREVQLADRV